MVFGTAKLSYLRCPYFSECWTSIIQKSLSAIPPMLVHEKYTQGNLHGRTVSHMSRCCRGLPQWCTAFLVPGGSSGQETSCWGAGCTQWPAYLSTASQAVGVRGSHTHTLSMEVTLSDMLCQDSTSYVGSVLLRQMSYNVYRGKKDVVTHTQIYTWACMHVLQRKGDISWCTHMYTIGNQVHCIRFPGGVGTNRCAILLTLPFMFSFLQVFIHVWWLLIIHSF